jgi:hypothetical protein
MSDNPAVMCRLCGLGIRDADAVAKVGGDFLHASCAELAYSDRSDWKHTEIGTLNQLSRGAISGGGSL